MQIYINIIEKFMVTVIFFILSLLVTISIELWKSKLREDVFIKRVKYIRFGSLLVLIITITFELYKIGIDYISINGETTTTIRDDKDINNSALNIEPIDWDNLKKNLLNAKNTPEIETISEVHILQTSIKPTQSDRSEKIYSNKTKQSEIKNTTGQNEDNLSKLDIIRNSTPNLLDKKESSNFKDFDIIRSISKNSESSKIVYSDISRR